MNSKTNRPIQFSYSTLSYGGGVVGVFEIAQQERPIYLLKDYGDTKANVVYIRRGDTTAQATPDEIAKMGRSADGNPQPALEFEFGNADTHETYGHTAELKSTSVLLPPKNAIPLYGQAETETPFGIPSSIVVTNRELYRDVADFLRSTTYLCPVALVVNNPSKTVAEDATLNLIIPAQGVFVASTLPQKPSDSTIGELHPSTSSRSARTIEVSHFRDSFHVRTVLGNIQPGTSNWARGLLYVGARNHVSIEAEVQISANNLQTPAKSKAQINIQAETQQISVKDLKRFVNSEY